MGEKEQLTERIKQLEMIENPKEMQERYNRYQAFDEFHDIAKERFDHFKNNDERSKLYEAFNMLYVCPGSRAGMDKRDIVEVFWGHKLYDSAYKNDNIRHFKFLKETGACITFLRKDDGFVTVYLDPAYTEKTQPAFETIILYNDLNPKYLKSEQRLNKIWKRFMAFTEVTHLDGKPSFCQKLTIYWLRFVKKTVKGDTVNPRRIVVVLYSILKWIFTIVSSGVILTAIQFWKDSKDNSSMTLEEIRDVVIQVDSTNQVQTDQLWSIKERIDTIEINPKQ